MKAQAIGMDYSQAYCLANDEIKKSFYTSASLFDFSTSCEKIVSTIQNLSPSILVFCSPERLCLQNNWHAYRETLEVAKQCKLKNPQTTVIFAGPPFYSATEIIERHPFVDIVIQGESELTLEDYLLARIQGRDAHEVKGIACRKDGKTFDTGRREEWISPSDIPDIYDDSYFKGFYGTFVCQTSFGCPYQCAYCPSASLKYRELPLERVKRGLHKALAKPEVTNIIFFDTDLAHTPKRFGAILEFLIEHNSRRIPIDGFWSSLPKLKPFIKTMRAAGFIRHIRVSMQTASPKALKLSRRQWMTPKHLAEVSQPLIAHFPEARLELILGLPGETPDSFRRGVLEYFKMGFRVFGFYSLIVSPGSEFYKKRQELGLEFQDQAMHIITRTKDFTPEALTLSRRFAYRFSVLAWLVHPEDLPLLESHGINILDIADTMGALDNPCDKEKQCARPGQLPPSAYVSGACFDDVPQEMVDTLCDFIDQRYSLEHSASKRLRAYLHAKRRVLAFERSANEALKSRLPNAPFPLVHAYAEIEVETCVLDILGLKMPSAHTPDRDHISIFLIFDINYLKAIPCVATDTMFFRRLLCSLAGAESLTEIFDAFDPSQKENVAKALATLHDLGLVQRNFISSDSAPT